MNLPGHYRSSSLFYSNLQETISSVLDYLHSESDVVATHIHSQVLNANTDGELWQWRNQGTESITREMGATEKGRE
jgi:hypothetical protein